jgi:hypothetical protein
MKTFSPKSIPSLFNGLKEVRFWVSTLIMLGTLFVLAIINRNNLQPGSIQLLIALTPFLVWSIFLYDRSKTRFSIFPLLALAFVMILLATNQISPSFLKECFRVLASKAIDLINA